MNYPPLAIFYIKIWISLVVSWILVRIFGEWNNELLLGMIFFLMWAKENKK